MFAAYGEAAAGVAFPPRHGLCENSGNPTHLRLAEFSSLRRSDLSIAPRCPVIRHSVGVTCLSDSRAIALGEQVTPTEYRSFHCLRAIERTLLRSVLGIPATGLATLHRPSLSWRIFRSFAQSRWRWYLAQN